jgi:hypothetical protein
MTTPPHEGISKSLVERDRKALVGELFRRGHRDVAVALIRRTISVEEAEKHLR